MIELIFTIDYEIYGNGGGSLRELVFEPAARLQEVFRKRKIRFVPFVEVAELETIEAHGTDPAIDLVKQQIRDFYDEGFSPALHLHPQWYKARREEGKWRLDYSEYNLCILPLERITQIVDRSLTYLREVLRRPDFTPFAFRAGNWLFQPTQPAARVLAQRGIRVDSSVYKGGVNRQHKLDYRGARRNGYYWRFTERAESASPAGSLLEVPIYTEMVPAWRMLTRKRIGLQQRGASVAADTSTKLLSRRLLDFLRLWYPLKLDFCRMTIHELTHIVDTVILEDRKHPTSFRPLVAIGHTKDLIDLETVEAFLAYLDKKGIAVSTFEDVYPRCE